MVRFSVKHLDIISSEKYVENPQEKMKEILQMCKKDLPNTFCLIYHSNNPFRYHWIDILAIPSPDEYYLDKKRMFRFYIIDKQGAK